MLSFTVRMRFEQEHHEQVKEHLRALTLASRQEPGCVSYIAHFVEDDPGTVLIYEQYVDEAALEHHRGTPHFHQYAIGGLYQLMKERSMESLTAVC
jgi:quinol monooxygenase YgiN